MRRRSPQSRPTVQQVTPPTCVKSDRSSRATPANGQQKAGNGSPAACARRPARNCTGCPLCATTRHVAAANTRSAEEAGHKLSPNRGVAIRQALILGPQQTGAYLVWPVPVLRPRGTLAQPLGSHKDRVPARDQHSTELNLRNQSDEDQSGEESGSMQQKKTGGLPCGTRCQWAAVGPCTHAAATGAAPA